MSKLPDNIGGGFPPSRVPPPPSRVPVSTGGLFPRDYRRLLREGRHGFHDVSEFNSTTVVCDAATPIIGTALHYHGGIRPDLKPKLEVTRQAKYYEEDPETEKFLGRLLHTLTPNQSRFEFDLNRPPNTTVYTEPGLAWGIKTWKEPLSQYETEFSLEKWYEFNTFLDCAVEDAVSRFGYAIVLDFHSYNYQRDGDTDWRTDGKPVINLGTRHLQLDDWGRKVVDEFLADLKKTTILGEPCLVEENGVFYGGYVNRRLAHLFGSKVITLSVEYKKVYMNENTGELYPDVLADLVDQMDQCIENMADRLNAPVRDRREYPFLEDPRLAHNDNT